MIYKAFLLTLSISLTVSLDPREEFSKFKIHHAKVYANIEEEELRFTHFSDNLKKIEKHNAEGHSWRMGITKFADLSKYIIILNIQLNLKI